VFVFTRQETIMDLSRSVEVCDACSRRCTQTAIHCLTRGPDHATRDHIRLLWDCSDICHVAASLMTRGSQFHREMCGTCATVCTACAESCERIDDPIMKDCAAICRDCARLCHEMTRART
jgi:hypothetical protein